MVKRPNIRPSSEYPQIIATGAYSIAYVNYDKEEDAQKAIQELNGTYIDGSYITVEVYEKK